MKLSWWQMGLLGVAWAGGLSAQMQNEGPAPMPPPVEGALPLPFRAPQEPRSHLSVGFGFNSGFSASIFGVGRIPTPDLPDMDDPSKGFTYQDGFVSPDEYYNPDATNPVGDTTNFGYDNNSQRSVAPNGDNLLHYHVYGSNILQDLGEFDSGVGRGWELKYERDLGRLGRARWGLNGGFSFSGADINRSETLTGDRIATRDTYNFGSNTIPVDDEGEGYSGGSFQRPVDMITNPNPVIHLAPLMPSTREFGVIDPGTAIVNGTYELSSAFYHFRLGPTVRVPIGKRFGLVASAGVAATISSSRFSAREELVEGPAGGNSGDDADPTVLASLEQSVSARDVAVGAYAETQAIFQISRSVSLFTGLNYVGTSTSYETRIDDEKYATVDVSSNLSVTGGFRFSF